MKTENRGQKSDDRGQRTDDREYGAQGIAQGQGQKEVEKLRSGDALKPERLKAAKVMSS